MTGLSCCERSLMVCAAVFDTIPSCDTRTDGRTDGRPDLNFVAETRVIYAEPRNVHQPPVYVSCI